MVADDSSDAARERLVAAAFEHVAAHGIGELSLRPLAAALGTSHRMLIYHFGSKDGLLLEVVRTVKQRQLRLLGSVTTARALSSTDQLRQLWRQVSDPAMAPYLRLFFELYSHALQQRPHTVSMLDEFVESWVEPLSATRRREGRAAGAARDDARLALGVIRGLALDLLGTGDRAAVETALERFLDSYAS